MKNLPAKAIDSNNALLCSLYSQVEFLRQEAAEKNKIIQSLISNVNVNVGEKTDKEVEAGILVNSNNTVDNENNGITITAQVEERPKSDIELNSSNKLSD